MYVIICLLFFFFFFFKQKTAYEMSIGDWSSDVCSSDLKSRPAMPISRLDLPLPFGPVIAQASPGAMLKVASRTAVTSPYATDRPRTARAGVPPGPAFTGLAFAGWRSLGWRSRGWLSQHGALREGT